jgi:hypothetical protein
VNWRDGIVIQGYGSQQAGPVELNRIPNPAFVGLMTERWKYVEYPTGEKELYDLASDPYELENQAGNPTYKEMMDAFSKRIKPQTGLTVLTDRMLPNATRGEPYSMQLQSWGGRGAITWSVHPDSRLPDGLKLSSDGVLSGTPRSAAGYGQAFRIVAQDSSSLPVYGNPQQNTGTFVIYLN